MDFRADFTGYKFHIGDRVVVVQPSPEHGKRGIIRRCYPQFHEEKPYIVKFDGSDKIHFVRESHLVAESEWNEGRYSADSVT